MGLTPADVHNVAFQQAFLLASGGYNEDEVDCLPRPDRGRVGPAWLEGEQRPTSRQVEQLDQQLDSAPNGPWTTRAPRRLPVVQRGPEECRPAGCPRCHHHPRWRRPPPAVWGGGRPSRPGGPRVLGLAQEMADRLTGEAKSEIGQHAVPRHGPRPEQTAVRGTPPSPTTMVNEARTPPAEDPCSTRRGPASETLERQARDKAGTLERDAQRQSTTKLISTITKREEEPGEGDRDSGARSRRGVTGPVSRPFLESRPAGISTTAVPRHRRTVGPTKSGYSFGPRGRGRLSRAV